MNRFEYIDPDGDRLRAEPFPGRPAILLILGTQGEDDVASLRIPTAHLEEVIAGLRDMARQAGAPARPTVVIHEKPADEAPIVVVVRPGTEGWIRA
jgi:hypothetical protein